MINIIIHIVKKRVAIDRKWYWCGLQLIHAWLWICGLICEQKKTNINDNEGQQDKFIFAYCTLSHLLNFVLFSIISSHLIGTRQCMIASQFQGKKMLNNHFIYQSWWNQLIMYPHSGIIIKIDAMHICVSCQSFLRGIELFCFDHSFRR